MGAIIERKRKNGSTAFLAQAAVMRAGKVARENKTFDRRPAANAWLKKREAELSKPGALSQRPSPQYEATLADAIDTYLAKSERAMGRTKKYTLKKIKTYEIAEMPCSGINSRAIVAFGEDLRKRVEPQTVGNYLSTLRKVFTIARPAWGYELDPQAMIDACKVLKELGATSKSRERERRPTRVEIDQILAHFDDITNKRPASLPMATLCLFAIFSTRRQEEITLLKWSDLDRPEKRILVRDMKNPGDKAGNDTWCDLPDTALAIIDSMPHVGERVFPFNSKSIGTAFTGACKVLEIRDLHFHDLRHDEISRLFELGEKIPAVAAVSGHRSWNSLKRYTHLRRSGDKYAGWDRFTPFATSF